MKSDVAQHLVAGAVFEADAVQSDHALSRPPDRVNTHIPSASWKRRSIVQDCGGLVLSAHRVWSNVRLRHVARHMTAGGWAGAPLRPTVDPGPGGVIHYRPSHRNDVDYFPSRRRSRVLPGHVTLAIVLSLAIATDVAAITKTDPATLDVARSTKDAPRPALKRDVGLRTRPARR